MAALYDMAKMTVSGTPGTGTITLLAAVSGFQTFGAAGVTNGQVISYSIQDGANWEVGRGTYTTSGTTLSRGALFSSNSNAAISATSAAVVWIAALAEDLIQSVTLAGNTSGTTAPIISPSLVFAGGQNITVSGTSNSITLSAPATSALSGAFGISLSTGGSTISIMQSGTLSFLEAFPPHQTTTTSLPNGATMFLAPFVVPHPLVINQAVVLASLSLSVMTSATGAGGASASASMASMMSAAIYSQMGAASSNSFASLASTVVTFSASQTISRTGATQTNGFSLTYPQGVGTSSTNLSSTSVSTVSIAAASSNFTGLRQVEIPFALTLQPGNYLFGVQGTTGSAGGSAMSLSGSFVGMTQATVMPGAMGATTINFYPGVGITSASATSIVPPSFNQQSVSSSASMYRPYFYLVNR